MDDVVQYRDEQGRLVKQRGEVHAQLMKVMNEASRDRSAATPSCPLAVYGILYVDGPVSKEALREAVMERVVSKVFRFRAVPRTRDGWVFFEGVAPEELDATYHFRESEGFEDDEAWHKALNQWSLKPMDEDKPFWFVVTVPKLPCGRAGVVLVTDHLVADGVALTTMTRELLCEGYKGMPMSSGSVKRPPQLQASLYARGWELVKAVAMPFIEPSLPGDKHNALKIEDRLQPQGFKAGFTESFALQRFKDIKNKVPGATVNDAMMAVTALALRRFYEKVGDPLVENGEEVRASFIMNIRPPGADVVSERYFGNDFITITCVYPMHDAPVDTLVKIRNGTQVLKLSAARNTRVALGKKLLPFIARDKLVDVVMDMNCKVTFTTSNVFLSHERMTVAGVGVDDMHFGTTAPLGLYVGIGTYANKVSFNVVLADETGVNPSQLVPEFAAALDQLHAAVMSASEEEVRAAERRQLPRGPVLPLVLGGLALAGAAAWLAMGAMGGGRDSRDQRFR